MNKNINALTQMAIAGALIQEGGLDVFGEMARLKKSGSKTNYFTDKQWQKRKAKVKMQKASRKRNRST